MKCPKCHHEIKLENYCTRCGIMIKNNEIISLKDKPQDNSLEYFIGEDYQKILKKNNWTATFLGPLYLVYRKCYLIGILLGYLQIIIVTILKSLNPLILLTIELFFMLFYCCYTNSIYIYIAKNRIKKINSKEKEILNKNGGTTIVPVFLVLLLYTISITLIFKIIN